MVINFFGKRGSGKTTIIKGQIPDMRPPVIIVDVLGNFDSPSYYQATSLSDAIQAIKRFHTAKQPKGVSARHCTILERVIVLKTGDPGTAADYLAACIWEIHGGTLVLDEVDSIEFEKRSTFDEFIRYGRNHKGDMITGCRRPAEIHKSITAAANKFYCFQTTEKNDIEYFKTIFGDDAPRLLTMPKYSGLFIDYERNIRGEFMIDRDGHIFHTKEIRF